MSQYNDQIAAVIYGTIAINTVATAHALDSIDLISEDENIYRHHIKHLCNLVEQTAQKLHLEIARRLPRENDKCFVYDFAQSYAGKIEPHIEQMQQATEDILTRHGINFHTAFPHLMTSQLLADIACLNHENEVKKCGVIRSRPGYVVNVSETMAPLRFHPIRKHIDELCRFMKPDTTGHTIDLNADPACQSAFKAIVAALGSTDNVKQALYSADKLKMQQQ